MRRFFVVFTVLVLTFANVLSAFAEDDMASLIRQLAEQQELNKIQQ
jgi:hypothetical protein